MDDSHVILTGLIFSHRNVNGDTKLTTGVQFTQDPGVCKGDLSRLSSLLLKLFNGPFVNSTTFVDQMASSAGLALISVSNNDDINMSPFFLHLHLSGGFHGTCVLETNMLYKSFHKIKYGEFPSIKF